MPGFMKKVSSIPERRSRMKQEQQRTPRFVCLRRSNKGFGFTISGNAPCFFSAVHEGGSAALAGLKIGDRILEIDGENVWQSPHNEIVAMIGESGSSLRMLVLSEPEDGMDGNHMENQTCLIEKQQAATQISNFDEIDASAETSGFSGLSRERQLDSDAEVWRKRQNFRQQRSQSHQHRAHHVASSGIDEGCAAASTLLQRRKKRRMVATSLASLTSVPLHHRPSKHCRRLRDTNAKQLPLDCYNSSCGSACRSHHHGYKHNFQAAIRHQQGFRSLKRRRPLVEQRSCCQGGQQALTVAALRAHGARSCSGTSMYSNHKPSQQRYAAASSLKRCSAMNRSASEPDVNRRYRRSQIQTSILGHTGAADSSDSSFSAGDSSAEEYVSDSTEDASSQDDCRNSLLLQAVVIYIGALPVPQQEKLPKRRIIRQSICSLHEQQLEAKMVLMEVYNDEVLLINTRRDLIAKFSADRIRFAAACQENKQYFGVAVSVGDFSSSLDTTTTTTTSLTTTTNTSCSELDSDSSTPPNSNNTAVTAGSATSSTVCHIFAVDHQLYMHSRHYRLAKQFGIPCIMDSECPEFPIVTGTIVNAIGCVYKRLVYGSAAAAMLSHRSCLTTTTTNTTDSGSSCNGSPKKPVQNQAAAAAYGGYQSSTSDSGIGNGKEDLSSSEVPTRPRSFVCPRSQTLSGQLSDASLSSFTSSVASSAFENDRQRQSSRVSRGVRFLDEVATAGADQQKQCRFNSSSLTSVASCSKTTSNSRSLGSSMNLTHEVKALAPILKHPTRLMPTPAPVLTCWPPADENLSFSGNTNRVMAEIHSQPKSAKASGLVKADSYVQKSHAPSATDSCSNFGSRDDLEAELDNIKRIISAEDNSASDLCNSSSSVLLRRCNGLSDEKRAHSYEALESRRAGSKQRPVKASSSSKEQSHINSSNEYQQPSSASSSRSSTLVRQSQVISSNIRGGQQRSEAQQSVDSPTRSLSPQSGHHHNKLISVLSLTAASRQQSLSTNAVCGVDESPEIDYDRNTFASEQLSITTTTTQHLDVPGPSTSAAGTAGGGGSSTASLRQKFSRLARGETLGGNRLKQERKEKLEQWANDFDKLLHDPAGLHAFSEFLKKQYSHENVLFWIACENYKVSTEKDVKRIAQEIFTTHFAAFCPQPVNIDSSARQRVEQALKEEKLTKDLFNSAQYQIFQLMKYDCYPRFVKSECYSQLWDIVEKGQQFKELKEPFLMHKLAQLPRPESVKSLDNDRIGKAAPSTLTIPAPIVIPPEEKKSRRSLLPWKGKLGKKKKDECAPPVEEEEAADNGGNGLSQLGADRRKGWKGGKQLSMPIQPSNIVRAGSGSSSATTSPMPQQRHKSSAGFPMERTTSDVIQVADELGDDTTPSPEGGRPLSPRSSQPPPDVVPHPDPPVASSPLPCRSQRSSSTTTAPGNCFVILPSGERRMVAVDDAGEQTVRQWLYASAPKLGLNAAATDLQDSQTGNIVDLSAIAATALRGRTVQLTGGVLFKVDIPPPSKDEDPSHRKVIAVKASADKTSAQVLRPILSKYGLQLDNLIISVVGTNKVLPNHALITEADGKKLVLLTHEEFKKWVHSDNAGDPSTTPTKSIRSPTASVNSRISAASSVGGSGGTSPTIEELATANFEQLQSQQNYLGIVELNSESLFSKMKKCAKDGGDSGMLKFVKNPKTTKLPPATFSSLVAMKSSSSSDERDSSSCHSAGGGVANLQSPEQASNTQRFDWREKLKEEKELIERLNRAQATRIDDQRGPLPSIEFELPDFLKPKTDGAVASTRDDDQYKCVVSVTDSTGHPISMTYTASQNSFPSPSTAAVPQQQNNVNNVSVISIGGGSLSSSSSSVSPCGSIFQSGSPGPAKPPRSMQLYNGNDRPCNLNTSGFGSAQKRAPPPYPGKSPGAVHSNSQGSSAGESPSSPQHGSAGSNAGTPLSAMKPNTAQLEHTGRSRKPVYVEDMTVHGETWNVDYV